MCFPRTSGKLSLRDTRMQPWPVSNGQDRPRSLPCSRFSTTTSAGWQLSVQTACSFGNAGIKTSPAVGAALKAEHLVLPCGFGLPGSPCSAKPRYSESSAQPMDRSVRCSFLGLTNSDSSGADSPNQFMVADGRFHLTIHGWQVLHITPPPLLTTQTLTFMHCGTLQTREFSSHG